MSRCAALALALVLGACGTTAPDPVPADRVAARVDGVLAARGFAPAVVVPRADGGRWAIAERVRATAPDAMERVVVEFDRDDVVLDVRVEQLMRSPTDWAVLGPLLRPSDALDADTLRREFR